MYTHLLAHAASSFEPVPSWLVTNGDEIVGPVSTELLVRGVLSGRIPRECRVCPASGGEWRGLDQVREVRSSFFGATLPSTAPREAMRWVLDARDSGEAAMLALHGACILTQASVGALYRVRPPLDLPVVSACYGDPSLELGEVVPRHDAALVVALQGEPVVLAPDAGAAARAVTSRLCADRAPSALAVVPIRTPLEVECVVELARFDHHFRISDVRALVPLMAAAAVRLEELAWET